MRHLSGTPPRISSFPPSYLFRLIPDIKARLHHSGLFYLGLFPIVLLLWAWADSGRHHSSWKLPAGRNVYLSLSCVDSRIEFERSVATVDESKVEPYRYIYPSGPLGWVAREEISARFRMRSFPGFERIDSVQQSADLVIRCYGFAIPLWLILAAYLPFWLALPWWHARRKQRRLLASLPISSPAQPQTD